MSKNIYMDVTCFFDTSFLSGIQRVVREVTIRLLRMTDLNVFLFVWRKNETQLSVLENADYLACYDVGCLDKSEIRINKKISLSDIEMGSVFFDLDSVWDPNCHKRDAFLEQFCKQGVVYIPFIHDVLPITHPEFWDNEITTFFYYMASIFEFADKVITSVNTTAESLSWIAKKIGVTAPACAVSWLGADFKTDNNNDEISDVARNVVSKGKYILYVGTVEPRKNHTVVLNAFDDVLSKKGINLVFAGRRGWGVNGLLKRIDMHPCNDKSFWFLEGQNDASIQYLYKNAFVVVFSTYDEGFGLPLVESLINGCVTIASDIPVLREIGGDFCEYFPPNDSIGLSRLIEDYIVNPEKYKKRKSLIRNYKPVLWNDVANKIKDVMLSTEKEKSVL